MSELTSCKFASGPRLHLMMSVSSLVLVLPFVASQSANADEDGGKETVWIELGGQLERVDGGVERFSPPFVSLFDPKQLLSPLELERPSRYSNGGNASIKFNPAGSSWTFSARVRYGRTESKRHLHQEYGFPPPPTIRVGNDKYSPRISDFEDTATADRESHAILDFQVGTDIGIGLFGTRTSSSLALGVRSAQFHFNSSSTIYARPTQNAVERPLGPFLFHFWAFQNYYATAIATRSFHGIGPSLAWNSSVPVVGNLNSGEIEIGVQLQAAALFGRQKVKMKHQTSAAYGRSGVFGSGPPYHQSTAKQRSRSVVVPNLGAAFSVAYRVENFKVSLGYRGDFFLGALDGGFDAHKTYDRNLYGPFASIAVGL